MATWLSFIQQVAPGWKQSLHSAFSLNIRGEKSRTQETARRMLGSQDLKRSSKGKKGRKGELMYSKMVNHPWATSECPCCFQHYYNYTLVQAFAKESIYFKGIVRHCFSQNVLLFLSTTHGQKRHTLSNTDKHKLIFTRKHKQRNTKEEFRVCDTFRQRDGDDDAISSPHPQSAAGHHQSCDSHKWEAQFTSTCNTHTEHTLVCCFNPRAEERTSVSIDAAIAHALVNRSYAL